MNGRSFVIEAEGSGRAADVSRRILAELRRGDPEPEDEIDLHGLDARAAERRVKSELAAARADGLRCVRVVHGRGLHSEAGAVLRERLPEWLTRDPLGAIVLAFARSPAGGGGSTLVLLRRVRGPAGQRA